MPEADAAAHPRCEKGYFVLTICCITSQTDGVRWLSHVGVQLQLSETLLSDLLRACWQDLLTEPDEDVARSSLEAFQLAVSRAEPRALAQALEGGALSTMFELACLPHGAALPEQLLISTQQQGRSYEMGQSVPVGTARARVAPALGSVIRCAAVAPCLTAVLAESSDRSAALGFAGAGC